MHLRSGTAVLLLAALAVSAPCASAQTGGAAPVPGFQADVGPRLADAFATARADNKRVLIVWGGDADAASMELSAALGRNPLSRTLLYEYEVVRADFEANTDLAGKYQAAAREGLPFFTILDAAGAVIANRAARPFRSAGDGAATWDAKTLNEFLASYKPTYVEAEPLLTAALSQAKKEGKTLFLWFHAPW